MRKLPSFQALRAFEAAARLQSFALAAEELHLTPSAVSHQVRGLERHFGRPLFTRRNRGVDLSNEGSRLLRVLSKAFDMVEDACLELMPDLGERSLSVHCTPSFASKWLGPRLPMFMRAHPATAIHMSSSAEPVDLLKDDRLDIAIAYGSAREQAGVINEPLGAERIAPLASPALLADGPFRREDMARMTLIESKLSPVRWPDWFSLNDMTMPPRPQLSFDRAALVISAAVDGLGVALESVRFAERELVSGELVILGDGLFKPIFRETHFVCYRVADRNSSKIAEFRDWIYRESQTAPATDD